jgi:hypothetical protein
MKNPLRILILDPAIAGEIQPFHHQGINEKIACRAPSV